jgi:hypothetical protein
VGLLPHTQPVHHAQDTGVCAGHDHAVLHHTVACDEQLLHAVPIFCVLSFSLVKGCITFFCKCRTSCESFVLGNSGPFTLHSRKNSS